MEKEDGEMSDDHEMLVDNDDEFLNKVSSAEPEKDCTVLYKAEKDGLIVKKLEKVDATKLEERAKRFGLNLTGNRVITQQQIDDLYANFGIESQNERHFRFDALYLNGVDGLSTKEIFEYLEDYKPISLEWIDDISCNVVCQDHISAALALLVHSCEIKDQHLKDMLAEQSSHHWRLGMPHPKNDLILMRFATNGEIKKLKKTKPKEPGNAEYDEALDSVSKNPWGDLCKSWGVYDHQEVFNRRLPSNYSDEDVEEEEPTKPIQIRNKRLAMRLGKRHHKVEQNSEESSSDSEWKSKSKAPRMRMHADDEETKIKKQTKKVVKEIAKVKDKYAPLCIEVANCENERVKREPTKLSDKFRFHGSGNQSSVRSRLGNKVHSANENYNEDPDSTESEGNLSDAEDNINIMSKVQKVSSKSNSSSVWSRLDIQQKSIVSRLGTSTASKPVSTENDLRNMLKSKSHIKSNDLRERLSKAKHANIRIEIDNN